MRQKYSSLRSKVRAQLFVALQAWQRQFCFEWMHQSNASQERVTATSGIWKGAKQAAMSYKTRSIVLQNKRRFHHWRRRHCRTACAILQQQENKQSASFCFGRPATLHHSCTFSWIRKREQERNQRTLLFSIVFWFLKMRSSLKLCENAMPSLTSFSSFYSPLSHICFSSDWFGYSNNHILFAGLLSVRPSAINWLWYPPQVSSNPGVSPPLGFFHQFSGIYKSSVKPQQPPHPSYNVGELGK